MNDDVRVFSPATVSNVACGFDILGFPLKSVGDEMTVRKTQERGLKINNETILRLSHIKLFFDIFRLRSFIGSA